MRHRHLPMTTTVPSDQNGSPPRVEVITFVQRRRRWSAVEKVQMVEETTQRWDVRARRGEASRRRS
jgi:hypothetical protein